MCLERILSLIAKLANSQFEVHGTLSLQNTAIVNPLNAKGEPSSQSSRQLLEKEGPTFQKELQYHLKYSARFNDPIVTKRHEPSTFILHVALKYQHPVLQCEVMIAYFGL